jgi:uncharacterized membrane protein YeaQ/YmgE (transglycosylase-associated protein family)
MDAQTMSWLSWIVVGGLAGWAANIIVKSRQGLPTNIIIGIAGALIGELFLNTIGASGINIWSLLVEVFGAVLPLGIGRLWVGSVRAAL